MFLVSAYTIVMIALQCTTCHPVSKLWSSPGACTPDIHQMGAMGFINAALDFSILLMPIRMVWSLKMSRKQKIAISGVFALGLL